ncbi:ArsA family ATPase [Microlunatus soli]|uniref:Anion-transporting ATPase, ArsA/GET3 family n=1 Tax=Microlunatus soli TaxID=630515 RepID=A0A1H1T1Y9_9ACTN|nr:ArsA-related P-loop ATPase [Microlunatus soli]SDS54275.1 Anion-transporting ATPase, ArsA/GET3 family [Microlunatus soli]
MESPARPGWLKPPPPNGPKHTLHIVSGKGGTGKTTIAASLACALATEGRRVLVCEVEGREGISQLFDADPLRGAGERRLVRTPTGGTVHGLSIDPENALMEYLETFYHLGLAGKALDRFGVVDFATSIAPGLQDVLLTGKVYEVARRLIKGLPQPYDAVVLDAPPTGRIAKFLNVPEAVADLAKMGPIRSQADSITALLRSEHTVVHLVTLLEDMPITETCEAVTDLGPTKIELGAVIANMATPNTLDHDQLVRAVQGELPIMVPGLSEVDNKALAAEFAVDAQRMLDEDQRRSRLDELRLPIVEIDQDPLGIDTAALFGIAARLRDQLSGEVRA